MKAVFPSATRVPGYASLRRRIIVATVGVATAIGSIACSSPDNGNVAPAPITGDSHPTPANELTAHGTLTPADQTSNAVTYDPALAPVGARMAVAVTSANGSTTAVLEVSDLLPNRGYAVHLHTNECGRTGSAAGPHFQHDVDPVATVEDPSTNPEYANPTNEIWLDVRTDATGSGASRTTVPFVFADRMPHSVILHEEPITAREPGKAGTAGDRLACLTLPDA